MLTVERKAAEKPDSASGPRTARDPAEPELCSMLFVSDDNLLGDLVGAAAHRQTVSALAALGARCEAVCRFIVPEEGETEVGPWLEARKWSADSDANAPTFHVSAHGIPVTLLRGSSTRPHVPDDGERAALLQALETALDERRPDVVVAAAGPGLSDVLAAAHARDIATVALQPDCMPREAAPFHEADVVLTPTRFAAEYLRESLGLPCAHLRPIVAAEQVPDDVSGTGAVVFDAATPGRGLAVFIQITAELLRRRPEIPVLFVGGSDTVTLPGGGTAKCVPLRERGRAWAAAHVLLAPILGWEHTPLTVLSAIAHGVPVIASNRGAMPELLEGAALMLPLPERLTPAVPVGLRPAEMSPWVDTILRLYDDSSFAASRRSLALSAGERWSADKLAPQYARFFAAVALHRRRARSSAVPRTPSRDGTARTLRKLAEAHPWPEQRPEDAAPAQEQGWLGAGSDVMLARVLSPATQLVVELGAWLGLSTRFIADHAPNAAVISIDHWKGSPEHRNEPRYQPLLPRLFETFQSRCWEYRDRVIPLQMTSLDGLRAVAESELQPDMIYVDAEHSFDAVSAELALARELFPRAALTGDDYDWPGVREAVTDFARRQGMIVDRVGYRGWRLLEKWQAADAGQPPPGRTQCVVLVPHMGGIESECDQALKKLEQAGVRVVRRSGSSQIDVARNDMISEALHDGAESILFIDSDIGFEPADALRILARPEPVISGVYAKKGPREFASNFADGVKEVKFGPESAGAYPLCYAATGFLRIKAAVLRRMIADLRLPLCNTHWGRGMWPFFMPMFVPQAPGKHHYLGEDWAFSYRLSQIGITPMADTSIRLWHWGRYGYSWEDVGGNIERYRTYSYSFSNK
jgi:hypothetical protein